MTVTTRIVAHRNELIARTSIVALVFFLHLLHGFAGRIALDSPAIIESNRTYLPVRAIANALGVSNDNIAWDAATNTATLVK